MPPKGWKKAAQNVSTNPSGNPVINVAGKRVELMQNGVSRAGKARWKGQVYIEGIGTVFINTYSKPEQTDNDGGNVTTDLRESILEVLTDLANRKH